jgi:uncharacterized protein YbjT (DUF2867 family)
MTTAEGAVYVVGAAGHQGGAAIRHLRERGVEAHALFDRRDVRRTYDDRWAEPGTAVADFDHPDSVEHVLQGVRALVLVLEDPRTGPAERLRHGRALVDAAMRAEVGHVVFVSATGPDHHHLSCDVSSEIAGYIAHAGTPASILRPTAFMEEAPWYWLDRRGRELVLAAPFGGATRLPLVALDDMGALTALAVECPGVLAGTSDVAGDVRTPLDIAEALAASLGEPVRHEEVRLAGVPGHREASTQIRDSGRLRAVYPGLHTFATWLAGGGLGQCRRAVGLPARRARPAA